MTSITIVVLATIKILQFNSFLTSKLILRTYDIIKKKLGNNVNTGATLLINVERNILKIHCVSLTGSLKLLFNTYNIHDRQT